MRRRRRRSDRMGEHSKFDTSAGELQGQILEGLQVIAQDRILEHSVKEIVDVPGHTFDDGHHRDRGARARAAHTGTD